MTRGETEPVEGDDDGGEEDDGDEDELPPEDEEGNDTPPKPEKPPKPKEPTFMDRYAKARGFRWHEAERCYTHTSGAWIDQGRCAVFMAGTRETAATLPSACLWRKPPWLGVWRFLTNCGD
jgi:hypothetical protein